MKNAIVSVAVLAVIVVLSVMQMQKKKETVLVEDNFATPASDTTQVDENKTDTDSSAAAVASVKTYQSKEFGVAFQYPKEIEIKVITATPKVLLSVSVLRDKNNTNTNDKETFAAAYPVKGEPTLEEIRTKASNTAVTLGANVWYRFVFPTYNKDIANFVMVKNGIEYSYAFPLTQEDAVKKILSTAVFTAPSN